MALALFDLDHTLIPFDSGQAWLRFLIREGHLEASFDDRYLAHCHAYAAGTLVIEDLMRLAFGVLARHGPTELATWQAAHRAEQAARVPAAAHALVQAHQARGDHCVLATATARFIAQTYADLLGIDTLIASEGEVNVATGRYTGEPLGTPSYGAGKAWRVREWLARDGHPPDALSTACFYSDSFNDLPLLAAVGRPVVVTPDARLRAHGDAAGWPVVDRLEDAVSLARV